MVVNLWKERCQKAVIDGNNNYIVKQNTPTSRTHKKLSTSYSAGGTSKAPDHVTASGTAVPPESAVLQQWSRITNATHGRAGGMATRGGCWRVTEINWIHFTRPYPLPTTPDDLPAHNVVALIYVLAGAADMLATLAEEIHAGIGPLSDSKIRLTVLFWELIS